MVSIGALEIRAIASSSTHIILRITAHTLISDCNLSMGALEVREGPSSKLEQRKRMAFWVLTPMAPAPFSYREQLIKVTCVLLPSIKAPPP